MWDQHRQDQLPNAFREIFRYSDGVKIRETATVDACFQPRFDFGVDLGTLNGLLDTQNPDTPARELSQLSPEAGQIEIGRFCAILRLPKATQLFAKIAKNDTFLHFSTPDCILVTLTIKILFVCQF